MLIEDVAMMIMISETAALNSNPPHDSYIQKLDLSFDLIQFFELDLIKNLQCS